MRNRYYFASAYLRHAEMTQNADVLEAAGCGEVVSSWHREVTPGLDNSFTSDYIAAHPAEVWAHGARDISDLGTADAIVSFTGQGGRGGRHVEHGVALMHADFRASLSDAPMRLIVVGPREHVFHCHPDIEVYPDFKTFLQHEIAERLMRVES
jgi:hypothetical protein